MSDDGKGMPTGAEAAKPGLGTGIVEALAKHLGAEIRIADANPGTVVSLVHRSPKTTAAMKQAL